MSHMLLGWRNTDVQIFRRLAIGPGPGQSSNYDEIIIPNIDIIIANKLIKRILKVIIMINRSACILIAADSAAAIVSQLALDSCHKSDKN